MDSFLRKIMHNSYSLSSISKRTWTNLEGLDGAAAPDVKEGAGGVLVTCNSTSCQAIFETVLSYKSEDYIGSNKWKKKVWKVSWHSPFGWAAQHLPFIHEFVGGTKLGTTVADPDHFPCTGSGTLAETDHNPTDCRGIWIYQVFF
jgi:hypothetical protein